jgi:phenylalanine-4-hydroxylase
MAFRIGGAYGLQKAVESKSTCTAVYSSGLQVTGTFTEFRVDSDMLSFIKTSGPSALSVNNKQLKGHGKEYHKDGFSSPVGKLKHHAKPLEDFTVEELASAGIVVDMPTILDFEGGVNVSGTVKNIVSVEGKIIIITFDNCTVTGNNGETLFDPSWGVYDMAVGEKITSVFCGAADKDAFVEIAYKSATGTHHVTYDDRTIELHKLYHQVRTRRHTGGDYGYLGNVWRKLQMDHHDDWLCSLEILELLDHENAEPELAEEIRAFLKHKAATEPEYTKLINDGFYLIEHPVEQKLVV